MASNLIDGLNKPSDILEAITLPGSSCVRNLRNVTWSPEGVASGDYVVIPACDRLPECVYIILYALLVIKGWYFIG